MPRAAAGPLDPQVDQWLVATFVGDEITLTGNFGTGMSRALVFTYTGGPATLASTSPLVEQWDVATIKPRIPTEVRSGTLTVVIDGRQSAPVNIYVYETTQVSTQLASNRDSLPLALAIAPDHRIWINDEFHTHIKWATPGDPTTVTALRVPQVAGGIFESSDQRTNYNVMGEDIWVDPTDGSVWFQEGGQYLYFGAIRNTSRIVRFDPATSVFSCFNVPEDNAEIGGLAVDHARNMVWYSESGWTQGNAIGGFSLTDASADCMWDPYTMPRTPSCPVNPVAGCHQRFPLPQANSSPMNMVLDSAGDLWFPEYTGNRIGRLDPDTGTITELPLPPPIARQGPGQYFGAGPFDIDIDGNGNFWITEQFDATITEIRPSLMATNDCTRLNALQKNPCMTEVWVGSNGFDNQGVSWLHAGLDGMIWFTVTANPAGLGSLPPVTGPNISTVGIVSTTQGNAVALLPALPNVLSTTGIMQDPVTRDVWFAEYNDRQLVRLHEAAGDGDAIPDDRDDCPNVYNPGQENSDAIVDQTPPKTVDDKTWIRSDGLGDACDPDDDNDGITDSVEIAGPPCASASGPTNPLAWDTDGDRVVDGVECALGTDPVDASSRPTAPAPGTDPDHDGLSNALEASIGTDPNVADSDGDGLRDGVEYLYYGSDPLNRDTDADGLSDPCEVASINADTIVNAGDQALLASEVGRAVPYAQKVLNLDLNKDGAMNAGDQAFMASKARPGSCP
jgi:streptogramin lyase